MNRPTVFNQVGPQETSTFYDNFRSDIQLMKQLNHNTFRTSIAWARLIPNGTGDVNPLAVKFYNDMLDELLANGIEPFINPVPFRHADVYAGKRRLGKSRSG